MSWKEMHNGEADAFNTTNSGICKLFREQAEVISFFMGTVECRTDLQKTYRFKGYKCSLQEKNGFLNPSCMDGCSLIQKEYI